MQPATEALIDLVGVLLRADTEGGLMHALANEGITDAYMAAMIESLKVLGPEGIAEMESRYDVKVSEDLVAQLTLTRCATSPAVQGGEG